SSRSTPSRRSSAPSTSAPPARPRRSPLPYALSPRGAAGCRPARPVTSQSAPHLQTLAAPAGQMESRAPRPPAIRPAASDPSHAPPLPRAAAASPPPRPSVSSQPPTFLCPPVSSQFQRRQREQRQYQPRNPKPRDDLRFRPAQRFEVVMQRRHLENSLAVAQLVAAYLQNHTHRFQQEDSADEQQ